MNLTLGEQLLCGGLGLAAIALLYFGAKRAVFPGDGRASADPSPQPTSPEKASAENLRLWEERFGPINPLLICPHCQTKGRVHAKRKAVEAGLSGAKVGAAIATGGLSALATGVAGQKFITEAACENCLQVWQF